MDRDREFSTPDKKKLYCGPPGNGPSALGWTAGRSICECRKGKKKEKRFLGSVILSQNGCNERAQRKEWEQKQSLLNLHRTLRRSLEKT